MATSEVDVYNLALSNAVAKAIVQVADEKTEEAETCKIHFQPSLEEVLQDHDWGFASQFESLAVLKDRNSAVPPPLPWAFEYEYPANCISVREITRENDQLLNVPFAVGINDANNGKVIYTDRPQAVARFTRRLTNPLLLSPKAVVALAWKLATRIIIPLTGNLESKTTAETEYKNAITDARAASFNEGEDREPAESDAITSRNT